MKAHRTHTKCIVSLLAAIVLSFAFRPHTAQAYAMSWQFPLGGDGYSYVTRVHEKYGTTVVNTNYNVRNLELFKSEDPERLTCFDMGMI